MLSPTPRICRDKCIRNETERHSLHSVVFTSSLHCIAVFIRHPICVLTYHRKVLHTRAMEKIQPVPSMDRYVCDDSRAPEGNVPDQYQGTAADRREMSMLGKKQVLRRQFKFMTMLGFASTVSKF